MIQTYYRVYCLEGGGKEYAGRIELDAGQWHVKPEGPLRFYYPPFSGTASECYSFCQSEFKCEIVKCTRERYIPHIERRHVHPGSASARQRA